MFALLDMGAYKLIVLLGIIQFTYGGQWQGWDMWQCEKSVIRQRLRSCTVEDQCEGEAVQKVPLDMCPNKVDGNWSDWGPWSACSKDCDVGYQLKVRSCDNPSPRFGGSDCEGHHYANRTCNTHDCPVDGWFGNWTDWSQCTKSCGGGQRWRTRYYHPAQHSGKELAGMTRQTKPCNTRSCPAWKPWGEWSECSGPEPCNEGSMVRYRQCERFGVKLQCEGPDHEIKACTVPCPVDGGWSGWSPWSCVHPSPCSDIPGRYRRYRACDNPHPMNNGNPCSGSPAEGGEQCVQPCYG